MDFDREVEALAEALWEGPGEVRRIPERSGEVRSLAAISSRTKGP
jgi:hypothetical protein